VNQRFYSLDVFRGATVAFMILVNNPGSWSHIFAPLEHAPWHGLTPTDLVFPFFLFAVGNAMAFVMPRYETAGDAAFWKKTIKRTALIFFIGLALNWFPFIQWLNGTLTLRTWTWINAEGAPAGVRILGVLQRIALCYFFASVIIYYAKPKGAFLIGALLLLFYWTLCLATNPADPYSLAGWFGTDVDKKILGEAHMYHGEGLAFDPEGLASTIPAIVQVIFGFLIGDYIRKRGKTTEATPADIPSSTNPRYQTVSVLFIAATALLVAGYAWNFSFPVNK
jgi:predicted acyltransferase